MSPWAADRAHGDAPGRYGSITSTAGSKEDPLAGWDPRRRAALERIRRQFKDAGGDRINLVDELLLERIGRRQPKTAPALPMRPPSRSAADRSRLASDCPRRLGPARAHQGRSGADVVARTAGSDDATISAVNYTETLQKATRAGVAVEDVDVALEGLGITVSPFGRLDARLAASFYRHRSQPSLADRVCLALDRSLSSVAFTADRAWETWADELGVAVRVIR